MTGDVQTWTVFEWGVIDGGILGAVIECVACQGDRFAQPCSMCEDSGRLHQPYRLPNGEPIDLERHAEILIQIEPQGGPR